MKQLGRLLFVLFALLVHLKVDTTTQDKPRHTHLVIVVDGLRPDYVTKDVMPRLTQLGKRGIVFNAHHSVFPTVTRVNASSFGWLCQNSRAGVSIEPSSFISEPGMVATQNDSV